jgi:hypothetical protein
VADVLYQAGEIVPRCGTTLELYVKDLQAVTLGGKPSSDWPASRLVGVSPVADGLVCVRLALWGGDRLKVRQPDAGAYVAIVRELAEVYTVDTDQVRLLALVQQARALTGYGTVKTGEQP